MTARYEDDPRWRAAEEDWLRPLGADESPAEHLLRGIRAAQTKYEIETEYEGGGAA